MDNKFWIYNLRILFKNNFWLKFVPTKNMTQIEKLNAIARYFIYLSIILYLYKENSIYIIFGIGGLILTIYLYKNIIKESFSESCTKPTYNNPYMNVLPTEYNLKKPPPCKINTEEQIKDFNQKKNFNLYKNVSDIFEKENFNRHFTVPTTDYINNQTKFAKWLYSNDTTCKDDLTKCIHKDLRRR